MEGINKIISSTRLRISVLIKSVDAWRLSTSQSRPEVSLLPSLSSAHPRWADSGQGLAKAAAQIGFYPTHGGAQRRSGPEQLSFLRRMTR